MFCKWLYDVTIALLIVYSNQLAAIKSIPNTYDILKLNTNRTSATNMAQKPCNNTWS